MPSTGAVVVLKATTRQNSFKINPVYKSFEVLEALFWLASLCDGWGCISVEIEWGHYGGENAHVGWAPTKYNHSS